MGQLFFSKELQKKMRVLSAATLSVVEAPTGYGKTTFVSRALSQADEKSVRWYTAVANMQDTSFSWFCRQIGAYDEAAANRLLELGYINRVNATRAAEIIAGMRIREPLILIFDNFQFTTDNWQPAIIDSLAKRVPDGLKTIFISQNLGRLRDVFSSLGESICFVGQEELNLSEKDIRACAEMMEIDLTDEQIAGIHKGTDGWTAAVMLSLKYLKEENQFASTTSIDDVIKGLYWNHLAEEEKETLLRLCLFERISVDIMERLLKSGSMPEKEVERLLSSTPLMRYQPLYNDYLPHEILTKFLKDRLRETGDDLRREIFQRAGDAFLEMDVTREAVNCYYQAEDYEAVLKTRLVTLIMETFDGVSFTEIAQAVLENCPESIQKKYPLSLLRLCYALYAGCRFDAFEKHIQRIRAYFDEKNDPQLAGEWYLTAAFGEFPDIEKMREHYLRAEELMEHPSDVFVKEEPFMFGCTSMWYLFYAEPGKMMETADRLEETLTIYNRLTNDHAAGAAELYRGECYSVRGQFEEADIQAYQAAFLSEQAGCVTVTYGAALLLGINAIYRSDLRGAEKAVDYLENKANSYAFLHDSSLNTYMVETVRGYLLGLMMETGRSALWTQGDADSLSDLTFTNFMIKTCRITDLLLKKEYKRTIASIEASLKLDARLISAPTKNFMYCGLALAYLASGRIVKASEYLDKSLEIAGRDKNYSFIACFKKYFQILFLIPTIASRHGQTIREIKALDVRYTRADENQIFSMIEEVPELKESLTEREKEVAKLAAEGLRNQEIAERLFISEHTVKQHIKSVFRKVNIDRRSKLIDILR